MEIKYQCLFYSLSSFPNMSHEIQLNSVKINICIQNYWQCHRKVRDKCNKLYFRPWLVQKILIDIFCLFFILINSFVFMLTRGIFCVFVIYILWQHIHFLVGWIDMIVYGALLRGLKWWDWNVIKLLTRITLWSRMIFLIQFTTNTITIHDNIIPNTITIIIICSDCSPVSSCIKE